MAKSILKAVHETAKSLHKAGTMDAVTMREFDALCLPPVKTYTRPRRSSVCAHATRTAMPCLRPT